MHEYTPNGATWEPQVDLVDDSDAPTASNLNAAPTGNADRAQWLYNNGVSATGLSLSFIAANNGLSANTFVWPKGVKQLVFSGYGGGGGGGGGPAGGTASETALAGGTGGAGSPPLSQVVTGTPGDTYTVVVGVGGSGGGGGIPGGAAASIGFFGGQTTVTGTGVALVFGGGAGGYVDNVTAATGSTNAYLAGPARGGGQFPPVAQVSANPIIYASYGNGGASIGSNSGSSFYGVSGSGSEFAGSGGVGGTSPGGEGSTGPASGGAGGGGGAGPGGNGGMGGDGGLWGALGGIGSPGAAGTAAAANTGAGGGGGGGGGFGSTSGGNGAAGSSGGSGFLTAYAPIATNV